MKFIYDSLDTVKTLKHPTKKDYITLTLAILGLVIFSAFFFILADSVVTSLYGILFDKFL